MYEDMGYVESEVGELSNVSIYMEPLWIPSHCRDSSLRSSQGSLGLLTSSKGSASGCVSKRGESPEWVVSPKTTPRVDTQNTTRPSYLEKHNPRKENPGPMCIYIYIYILRLYAFCLQDKTGFAWIFFPSFAFVGLLGDLLLHLRQPLQLLKAGLNGEASACSATCCNLSLVRPNSVATSTQIDNRLCHTSKTISN